MTLIRPPLDYTAKDFDALQARLFNVIPSAFPEWTDTQVANFGNLLTEMFAYVGDVLLFYQDNQANESRWSSAILRKSLLSMAKLIGFKAKGASAATATLTFQLNASPAADVTINAGDIFATADTGIRFQALTSTVIPAGAAPPVAFITVENSESVSDSFASSGLADQSFLLSGAPYVDGSLVVNAEDGLYVIVDDLLKSQATDRHVTIAIDENSRVSLRFGNGVSGAIPVGAISCTYKTGGGAAGNVDAGKLKRALTSYADANGTPVAVKIVNAAKATGGSDIQTVESMREEAPRGLRVLTRTVGREDYEINAARVPGVARALMLTSDELPTILENRGKLFIVPEGGGVATYALLSAVAEMVTVTYPKTITFKPTVVSAKYTPVNISTRVHFTPNAVPAVVAAAIKKRLVEFFAINAVDGSRNNKIDFGYYLDDALAWSDVFNVVRDTPGVRKIDDGLGNLVLNNEADDVELLPDRFPVLGSVVVINAKTGQSI